MCGALTPQLYGIVAAAGCQKRRRRVKRNSGNPAAVLRQSGHKSRRRVVGGQQVTEVTGPLCPFRVATQVADELFDDNIHNLTVISWLPVARSSAVG